MQKLKEVTNFHHNVSFLLGIIPNLSSMKHFSFLFRLMVVILITNPSIAQKAHKPFVGYLQYRITPVDTALAKLYPEERMNIYTNDTIVRIEMESPKLGQQVTIRHMEMKKAYLLVNSPIGKYAIQRDFKKEDTVAFNADSSKYQIKKKRCKRKILNKRANRLTVKIKEEDESFQWLYLKNYSTQIINAFEHQINGLPVLYHVKTPDALLKYELIRIVETIPQKSLFLLPEEFEVISFKDFMDKIIEFQQGPPPTVD